MKAYWLLQLHRAVFGCIWARLLPTFFRLFFWQLIGRAEEAARGASWTTAQFYALLAEACAVVRSMADERESDA